MLQENLPGTAATFLTKRLYPSHILRAFKLKDGKIVTIRPIRPEDEPLLVRFHQTLSDRSVYFRYFHMIGLKQRVDHERLSHICHIDYATEMVLVGEYHDPQTGQPEVVGVGRLNKITGSNDGEFAILISDTCQGLGLGSELLRKLIQFGRDEKLEAIIGEIHPGNLAMRTVCRKLGFAQTYSQEDHFLVAKLTL
jgi:acetyltransferase